MLKAPSRALPEKQLGYEVTKLLLQGAASKVSAPADLLAMKNGNTGNLKTQQKNRVSKDSVSVEHRRLELLTPTLPVLCATNCANAPQHGLL